jgi:hypothetical protein
MNTNALARHYDKLTPWERLPLIMAASARGDEAERRRLVDSAPTVILQFPNYTGLAHAFRELADFYLMELLEVTAAYFMTMGCYLSTRNAATSERMLGEAYFRGFLFKVKLAGWRQFCQELSVDPELCWSYLPGLPMIKTAEEMTENAAFVPEGAIRYLERGGSASDEGLITAEGVAAKLHEILKIRAAWWGCEE